MMKKRAIYILLGLLLTGLHSSRAQLGDLKWIRIGELQSYYSGQGAEFEAGRPSQPQVNDGLYWPSTYGSENTSINSRGLWIGCKNFNDPVLQKVMPAKVVGRGTRDAVNWKTEVFPVSLKMIGRFDHPLVTVDGAIATENQLWDEVDEINENLPCDRMIVSKFNTSIGVSVTRRVMGYSQQNHDDYFIYEYIFKNTGIINAKGDKNPQTLQDVYFGFFHRWALSGESVSGYNDGWGTWESTWGRNTVNQVIGQDPKAAGFEMRAAYSWYGPHSDRSVSDDWGCPNETADLTDNIPDETMSAARYIGMVVLHADKSSTDKTDDTSQPRTTAYVGSDDAVFTANQSQYDEVGMQLRYEKMIAGHPAKTHADEVGDGFANQWGNDGGGYLQSQCFGPYTLAPGDSVRLVMAEALNGLSREKNREVARNWLTYEKGAGTPALVLPNGSPTNDVTAYKKAWVQTSKDSLLQSFRSAIKAFKNNLVIPQPPPPPAVFTVASGGDRISLSWDNAAESSPKFNGYEVWRAKGLVLAPTAVYEKIWECDRTNLSNSFDDVTAQRGVDYYYYVVSKDDGSQNDLKPGKPLVSSKFYTLTNQPAYLRRPAGDALEKLRVVPNPYVISKRSYQFGAETGYDRIAFYNTPPFCKISVYTERGELIWEKEHTNGSGDELWESVTSSGQIIVSGIYIAYIEVTQDYTDASTGVQLFKKGDNTYRKIMVIR